MDLIIDFSHTNFTSIIRKTGYIEFIYNNTKYAYRMGNVYISIGKDHLIEENCNCCWIKVNNIDVIFDISDTE